MSVRGKILMTEYNKGGLSLKTKNLHIQLYFIATTYLCNNALVEHKDN